MPSKPLGYAGPIAPQNVFISTDDMRTRMALREDVAMTLQEARSSGGDFTAAQVALIERIAAASTSEDLNGCAGDRTQGIVIGDDHEERTAPSAKQHGVNGETDALARPASRDTSKSGTKGQNTRNVHSGGPSAADALAASSSGAQDGPLDYTTYPRPTSDYEREFGEDKVEEMYNNTIRPEMDAMNAKSPNDHPHWIWIVSKPALKLFNDMSYTAQFINPDAFGMYIYNDFAGYGLQEIIENALKAFNDEFKKKNRDAVKLWTQVEALLFWLNSEDLMQWAMCEDGDRVGTTIHLIGCTILTALNALKQKGMLTTGSSIRNVSLVLSLVYAWIEGLGDVMDCDEPRSEKDWPRLIVEVAKTAQIQIDGVHDISKILKPYNTGLISDKAKKTLHDSTKSDAFGFVTAYKNFASKYGRGGKIGGHEFDISKMTKTERKKYAFDGKDPFDSITFE